MPINVVVPPAKIAEKSTNNRSFYEIIPSYSIENLPISQLPEDAEVKLDFIYPNTFTITAEIVDESVNNIFDKFKYNTWTDNEVLYKELQLEEIFKLDGFSTKFYTVDYAELLKGYYKFKGTEADLKYLVKTAGYHLEIFDRYSDPSVLPCGLTANVLVDLDSPEYVGIDSSLTDYIYNLLKLRRSLCTHIDHMRFFVTGRDIYPTYLISDEQKYLVDHTYVDSYFGYLFFDTNWKFDGESGYLRFDLSTRNKLEDKLEIINKIVYDDIVFSDSSCFFDLGWKYDYNKVFDCPNLTSNFYFDQFGSVFDGNKYFDNITFNTELLPGLTIFDNFIVNPKSVLLDEAFNESTIYINEIFVEYKENQNYKDSYPVPESEIKLSSKRSFEDLVFNSVTPEGVKLTDDVIIYATFNRSVTFDDNFISFDEIYYKNYNAITFNFDEQVLSRTIPI